MTVSAFIYSWFAQPVKTILYIQHLLIGYCLIIWPKMNFVFLDFKIIKNCIFRSDFSFKFCQKSTKTISKYFPTNQSHQLVLSKWDEVFALSEKELIQLSVNLIRIKLNIIPWGGYWIVSIKKERVTVIRHRQNRSSGLHSQCCERASNPVQSS